MLDIKFIRENKEIINLAAKKKRLKFDVGALLKSDDERRELMTSIEKKRAEQNEFGSQIPKMPPGDGKTALLSQMKMLKDSMQAEEDKLTDVMKHWRKLMLEVPNIPDMSVPEGESDAENKEVHAWGKKPIFDFEPKSHIELMENLDLADFTRGAEVSGFRGYFLKNEGVLLEFALWNFALDFFRQKGFMPMRVPSLVRQETLLGSGYLPQGEDDLYKTQDNEYLAGTAEVATMSYFADAVLSKNELPKKVIAFSDSFRREAGSYGKDTKGLIRVHEFYKLEQVVLCEASHETSVKFHEELLANAEALIQALELPYRVVVNCSGDLGLGQVKKYDIEAWVPSQKKYVETHSCSYFHDFQTRRLNIKYKDDDGKTRFAHSLNNTAIATPRILVQLIENNQLSDGSVKVPKVLIPYLGTDKIVSKR